MQHDEKRSPAPDPAPSPAAPYASPSDTAAVSPGRIERAFRRIHPATWPLGLAVLGLAGATLLHFVDPSEPGNYPTCPWLLLTGTFCPGCGTMRAIALVTHLDILGAVSMNPLLFLLVPYILFAYATWLIGTLRPRTRPRNLTPTWLIWSILVAFVFFWVARNLPWFSFLAPGTPLLPGW